MMKVKNVAIALLPATAGALKIRLKTGAEVETDCELCGGSGQIEIGDGKDQCPNLKCGGRNRQHKHEEPELREEAGAGVEKKEISSMDQVPGKIRELEAEKNRLVADVDAFIQEGGRFAEKGKDLKREVEDNSAGRTKLERNISLLRKHNGAELLIHGARIVAVNGAVNRSREAILRFRKKLSALKRGAPLNEESEVSKNAIVPMWFNAIVPAIVFDPSKYPNASEKELLNHKVDFLRRRHPQLDKDEILAALLAVNGDVERASQQLARPSEDKDCLICFDRLFKKSTACTPCGKMLHESCLADWLARTGNCPGGCNGKFSECEEKARLMTC